MRFLNLQIQPDDAKNAPDGWQVVRQRDFRGGESQLTLPEQVGRNQLIRMENVLIDPRGRISQWFHLENPALRGATPGVCLARTSDRIYTAYRTGDGYLYATAIDTVTVTDLTTYDTATHIPGAYISGVSLAVTFLGKRYCINPGTTNGILNLTDGVLIHIPERQVKSLQVYMNRLWLINTDGTIQISDNGDATAWDPLNILWLANQEPALAFIPVQGGAIVYGESSIYAMYGSDYLDITFVPLMLGGDRLYTTGYAEINGTAYILSADGITAATLNGAKLLDNPQPEYFPSIAPLLADHTGDIVGLHLKQLQAVYFTWSAAFGGTHGLMYYYNSGTYSKADLLLPADYPYAVALNDRNTDFLVGTEPGVLAKSQYPICYIPSPRQAIIQTRHEDCDSNRDKVWQHFAITIDREIAEFTLEALLDEGDSFIAIAEGVTLQPGETIFPLNAAVGLATGANFPAGRTISFRMTIGSGSTTGHTLTDEITGATLTDEDGGALTVETSGIYAISELRLKYCLAGVDT